MCETKLYFKNEDATKCYPLAFHIKNAKDDGLEEIELFEAYPDDDKEFVYCKVIQKVCIAKDCTEHCEDFTLHSREGKCIHTGLLMAHGDKVKFKVE